MMAIIAEALNEEWTPDWNNNNESKYHPWFNLKSEFGFVVPSYVSWTSYSSVGSLLCFKTRELAIYAGKQFTDIYKGFMVI